uniref:Ribosomal protein L2 C-terminal domain-containing protein n=1 Tax=Plectus sambesii TaxID=2011161 RepID=A0A914VLW8_9BILA
MSLRAVSSVTGCGYALRSRLASALTLSSTEGPLGPLGAKRHLPKRGTKPLPQFLWDKKHLEELTGGEYTHKPLRVNRLGGRDPETGRKVNQHIGGGVKFDYFMIDNCRRGPSNFGAFYEERVLEVRRDPNRGPHIALVAGSKGKRWILATENMSAGQVIKTSQHIPDNPVLAAEGNAYPLGALSPGTVINSIEKYPGKGGEFIIAAGSSAEVVRHQGDYVVIRMPNKHEFALHKECMATVGKLSHGDLKDKIFGSPNMHRRFGYRPSSGLFHKKDGYFGRKIRRLPPVRTLDQPDLPPCDKLALTLTKTDLTGLFGTANVHNLLASGYSGRDYHDE